MQHASIGSDRAGLSDIMDCLVLHCSAPARAAAAEVCETEDQLAAGGRTEHAIREIRATDLRCRSRCAVQLVLRFPTSAGTNPVSLSPDARGRHAASRPHLAANTSHRSPAFYSTPTAAAPAAPARHTDAKLQGVAAPACSNV
jgi:hypothetical protein